ncbi:MAG TPA: sialidase family protein [Myxococcota bacterium]
MPRIRVISPIGRAAAGLAQLVLVAACALPCTGRAEGSIERVDPAAAAGSMAPSLADDGRAPLLSWLEPEGGGYALRLARLEGRTWRPLATIARGARFFVNAADFPSVARGADGSLWAHWLEKTGPGTYAYAVQLARSSDGGATWTPLGPAHDDAVPAEHGFASYAPEAGGVRVFWLDGRATRDGEGGIEAGAMTLRTAVVEGAVRSGEVLDTRVCDCCQTAAAPTAAGPVVIYRDRSEAEVRDVFIVRREGQGWSRPAPVHEDGWNIRGCPVNGPAVASDGDRALAVAWFTAADDRPRVQVAFSKDAGASFAPPVVLDDARPAGHVDVALDAAGDAVVSWLAKSQESGGEVLRVARVTPDGRAGAPLVVAADADAPPSGFPRMLRLGETLVLTWAGGGEERRVRAATLPVSLVPALAPLGNPGGSGNGE